LLDHPPAGVAGFAGRAGVAGFAGLAGVAFLAALAGLAGDALPLTPSFGFHATGLPDVSKQSSPCTGPSQFPVFGDQAWLFAMNATQFMPISKTCSPGRIQPTKSQSLSNNGNMLIFLLLLIALISDYLNLDNMQIKHAIQHYF
jgi:hypothetical protein